MKSKTLLSTLIGLFILFQAQAQSDAEKRTNQQGSGSASSGSVPNVDISEVALTLSIPSYVSAGTNGAGVAYDPVRKLYYTAFAGNSSYPLIVFDDEGRVVNDTGSTQIDVRGLWYNSKTSSLEANGYSDYGIVQYVMNKRGVPSTNKTLFSGTNQPDDNSVGAFDPVHNEILYFNLADDYGYAEVVRYSRSTGKKLGDFELQNFDDLGSYNNVAVYTGIKGSEIAIIDYDLAIIMMYDISSGKETKEVTLPLSAVVEDRFNFAFANGMFWLFDTNAREWNGYKMPN